MHRALLISLLLAPAVLFRTAGATASEWDLIRACSENADPDTIGLAELEQACPGLEASLVAVGYEAFLSDSERDALSVYGLDDLVHLGAPRESANAALQTESLRSVLEGIEQQTNERPPSWWDRFKNWLQELIRRRADEDSWLDEWLQKVQPSEVVVRTTLYSLVGLVILLAVLIVINELRAAGVLKRRTRDGTRPGSAPASRAQTGEGMSIAELDALPLQKRPAALLRIVVAALVRAGRLRSERSLTYRELVQYARFADEGERTSFQSIASAAERSVYGASAFAEQDVELLVREGRALQARLAERAA